MIIGCSGFGIIIGSVIAGRFLKHYTETEFIPLSGALVCLIGMLLLSSSSLAPYVIIIFLFSMGGALFIASFNALIQCHAKEGELGKILTGNNFIQNIGMLLF
ncbi:hypothetical protein [Helicobacter mastomyrinus]|uniref:MFS transporter n=1 Tax=Helicobacter mastomyrinus TaxID=287948 RepID=A0ABZ3F5T4_9HELI|nr:hypothetical protein [uncultured Helicobacter sp.]